MPRPQCCRRITQAPRCVLFNPAGVPACDLEVVVLSLDEFEALRLVDFEGLYQERAAEQMNVSRQTIGRILEAARKKVVQVLLEGKALRIEGGEVEMNEMRTFTCQECQRPFGVAFGDERPAACPNCKSANIERTADPSDVCGGHGHGQHRHRHGQNK